MVCDAENTLQIVFHSSRILHKRLNRLEIDEK